MGGKDLEFGDKNKYLTLINILDRLREEAPEEYKSYHPLEEEVEKLNKARSKTFIHLYLKVKFGILDFKEREGFICDGAYDGGIDAYYIDKKQKNIFFIQSKFRTNAENFHNKEIELNDILNMDIDRLTDGETRDENGNNYNKKILKFMSELKTIDDIARYRYEVIILANLKKITPSKFKRLVPGYPCTIYDFQKCYDELVFPVVSGTYYHQSNLFININLTNKDFSQSRISYPVTTEYSKCEITILFVPTIEIAKILHKYKNSILKYNPRSYLDLSTNSVNKEIARTIKEKSTNDFSLFNNGITILSDETSLNEKIGHKNKGQLHIKNPQIINGGQTAYTLSKVYEEALENGDENIFTSKEVMLKIITFTNSEDVDRSSILQLIEEISKATNQQTAVSDADRRSNDKIQIDIQHTIFEKFGYYYERKRGEFYDGLKNKYIDKFKIVDRELFLRICYSIVGLASQARRNSEKVLFNKDSFDNVLNKIDNYTDMFFSYLCYKKLEEIQKKYNRKTNNKFGVVNYGNALRYGKMAVVSSIYLSLSQEITTSNFENLIEECL